MNQSNHAVKRPSPLAAALPLLVSALLAGCANYGGIGSDKHMTDAATLVATQSVPAEQGRWPDTDWFVQFGDPQLADLIREALAGNPSLDRARARVVAAAAATEGANADTLPHVGADLSATRQQYSAAALVPPPYAGSWQTEYRAVATASYNLDLWGKRREVLRASVSNENAARAEAEQVRLTLTTALSRSYNDLARLYALHDIADAQVAQLASIERFARQRVATGLDTEVESRTAEARLATARQNVKALDGRILAIRYQLAALLGQGPDRGLTIARPALGAGDTVRLPDNLPVDLVSRRPDLVAARMRVEAGTHGIKVAKAEFYPDINLIAALGFDALGFGRFLTAGSRVASAGPAIHIPIFDAGALRAQLKGSYADFETVVADYNQTLIGALSEVATELSDIRSIDAQLADAEQAEAASRRALELALAQYRTGLTSQLTVWSAQLNELSTSQAVTELRMARRDRQIALAGSLGGGYTEGGTLVASR
ncbi:efflux transporter outer membrane subunit [Pandoraea terrae]